MLRSKHQNMKTIYALLIPMFFLIACGSTENQSADSESSDSTVIETEVQESKIVSEEIVYNADSVEMIGFLVFDANNSEPKPGILVVHEWWGHNEHSRNQARKLAEMGYVALAVDMYGDGKQAKHPKDAGKFAGMVMSNLEGAKARFEAAYQVLASNENTDPEKIGAIGFCFGGSVVLTMANSGMNLDAVAAFHSGVQLPVMPNENLKAKVLVCNGEDDPMVPAEQAMAFKDAMDAAGADYKYISYPGVVHAFTNPGADSLGAKFNLPLAYDENADRASWEEMELLFSSTFK